MIKVGCCGFAEARAKYFKKFDLVEIQQTLYQVPSAKTAAQWRREARAGFEFTMKAWQLITFPPASPTYEKLKHPPQSRKLKNYGSFQLTSEVLEAWEQTEEVARALGARVIVFESPESFIPEKTNIDNLTKFFGSIERGAYRMVWEARGRWPEDLVVSLCRDLDLTYSIDPFVRPPFDGPIRYFKLHGKGGDDDSYTDNELMALRRLLDKGPEAYVLFNNQNMLADAGRMRRMIR